MRIPPASQSVRVATTAAAVALGSFGLLAAPIDSGGALGASACQWSMTLEDVPHVWDKRHVTFFFSLSTLLLWGRTRSQIQALTLAVLGYGVVVELSQSLFTRGHCRIWDLVANVIGLAISLALLTIAERINTNLSRARKPSPH